MLVKDLKLPIRQTEFPLKRHERPTLAGDHYISVSMGFNNSAGLKTDGTCFIYGNNQYGQLQAREWTNLINIKCNNYGVLGLFADGTCKFIGMHPWDPNPPIDVSSWTNIVDIDLGAYNAVGIKEDGTCVSTGRNDFGQGDVYDWTDIVQIQTTGINTLGLKEDGTCVFTGAKKDYLEGDVSSWTDIVEIGLGDHYAYGIKSNGTIVSTESNDERPVFDLEGALEATDIVMIAPGNVDGVFVNSKGETIVVGGTYSGNYERINWKNVIALDGESTGYIALLSDGTCVANGDENTDGRFGINGKQLDTSFYNYLYRTKSNKVYGYTENNKFEFLTDNWNSLTDADKIKFFDNTNKIKATKENLLSLKEPFTILSYCSNKSRTTASINAIPNTQIIRSKEYISLKTYDCINKIDIIYKETNNSHIKILIQTDDEIYKTYKNNQWINCDINNINKDGLSPEQINNFTAEEWNKLNADKILFVYSISLNSSNDEAYLDNISMNVNLKGIWRNTAPNDEYEYRYMYGDTLSIKLLKDGDYKINYTG